MYRNKEIKIRLTEKELERLNRNASKTTFSREGYIRTILSGYDPQASPHEEYWGYIRELWDMGDELNSIADGMDAYNLDLKKRTAEASKKIFVRPTTMPPPLTLPVSLLCTTAEGREI